MPKMRLKVVHTHAGEVRFPGHVIDVDDFIARWLIDHGIAEPHNCSTPGTPNPVLDGMVDVQPAAPTKTRQGRKA